MNTILIINIPKFQVHTEYTSFIMFLEDSNFYSYLLYSSFQELNERNTVVSFE